MNKLLVDVDPLRTSRSFRYLFAARSVSLLGLGFLIVALPLQVHDLTGSTGTVAAVAATLGLSSFIGTLSGGVLADRYDRRRIILTARTVAGIGYGALTVNAFLPEPFLAVIFAAAVLDGVSGGISATALMTVMPGLVPRQKLPAAAALMAITADLGSVLGPAIGGLLIAATDVGVNFLIATLATVATSYLLSHLPAMPSENENHETPWQTLTAGFRYATSNRVVGGALTIGFVSMLMAGWAVLVPEYAKEVLRVDEDVTGLLYTAPAVGAVLGSLFSGWTGRSRRHGRIVIVTLALSAASLIGAGATATVAVTLLALVAYGAGEAVFDVVRFSLLHATTPDHHRGRVSGAFTAQVSAGASLGAVGAGIVSSLTEPSQTFVVYGLIGLVGCALVWVASPTLRSYDARSHAHADTAPADADPEPSPA